MIRSQGILTSAGGTNSHAAVVARGEGIPAVCGADAIRVDRPGKRFTVGSTTVAEGRRLKVRANADTPQQAANALERGAEGIGLCRTEHMFLGEERVAAVRTMIFASTVEEEQAAYDVLAPLQREDFIGIFKEMDGKPVTVRLLDPPLHEFLPDQVDLAVAVALAEQAGQDE